MSIQNQINAHIDEKRQQNLIQLTVLVIYALLNKIFYS